MKVKIFGVLKDIPIKYHKKGRTGLVNLTKSANAFLKSEYPNYYKHQYQPQQKIDAENWDNNFCNL